MRKLKDSLTLRKFEVQSVATQAKRLAAAGRGKKFEEQSVETQAKRLAAAGVLAIPHFLMRNLGSTQSCF